MRSLPDILAGCKIFPCQPGSKDPATAHGWKDATDNPAQIAEWQRINPDFNWAVSCGLSDLYVFDVDPGGLDWWAKLRERDARIKKSTDEAFTVRTPKGGLHVYYQGEGPSTASRIAQGIDTRGGIKRDGKIVSGGYVILPGSATKAGPGRVDGVYEALPGGVIAALPDFMRALVPERKKTEVLGLDKNPDKDLPRNIQTANDLIAKYVRDGNVSVEGKGGNNRAFQVACSILDKGISPGLTFDLLWEKWNEHCQPPWEDFELETIVRNAAAHGEDTGSGAKGFQANEDAFANFAGQNFEPPAHLDRDKILALHDYADGVSDPTWLIPGLIPSQGIGMFYGNSGSFKSFVALDMALSLAYGVAGQWGAPPVKNDVLFIAGEGAVATAKKRWPAWMEWRGIEFRNDHRFFIKDRVPFFSDREGWEKVKLDLAILKCKPAFIVIDTLTRLLTGMDENAAKDTALVTSFLEDLARYFECFVLVIHHTGKDENKGARGSSAWFANMDTVLSAKKSQSGTHLTVRKQKDADIEDETRYLEIKEFGTSLVLEHSENGPSVDQQNSPKGSRYAWASVGEVVSVLTELGGETSHNFLAQEIVRRHGIDLGLVKTQLKNGNFAEFRPDKDTWRIPRQEYDL